ncbi:MAG: helix-turn-helix transcriptional regulator, partial [Gammaproteobacteria bacterium]
MNPDQYDELIGKIYDAALTPALWSVFLEQLAEIFHSNGALIYLVDFSNRSAICHSDDISFIRSVRMPPDLLRDYDRYYSTVNVWLEHSKNLAVGLPVPTAALFPEAELSNTEWFNDWLKPNDYYRCLIGHLLQQDTLTVRMSIFRNKQRQFEKHEIALLSRIMPHLQRSCLFYKNLADLKSNQRVHANLLNRLPVGIVLIDKYGQTIFINEAAERLARAGYGFKLDAAGRCVAGNAEQTGELRRRVKHVLDYGRSSVMTLRYPHANHPLHAIILPLHDQS